MFKSVIAKLLLCLTITASLCIVTGCGSNSGSSSDGKVLKVGTDATFQPFEWLNDNGEYTGFDIDLMNAVAKKAGYAKVEYINTDFKGLIPGLQAKKFDVICSAMYVTEERQKTIDFSDSYYPGGLCIMVLKDNNTIHDITDLYGRTAAVQIGTKSAKLLEEEYPAVQRLEVETNNEMFLSLESKKVDAVVTGKPAAEAYSKQSGRVKILDKTLTEELYAYGIRKDDGELKQKLNDALKAVKEDGEYEKIRAAYFE